MSIRESITGDVDPASYDKDAQERQFSTALYQYWQEQVERIQQRIAPKVPKSRKALRDITDRLDRDFWRGEEGGLLAILLPFITTAIERAIGYHGATVEATGIGFDWTMTHTEAGKWARKYAGELIKGITDTTHNRVKQVIETWFDMEQATLDDLIGALSSNYGFSPQRARLIAITETTRAYSRGELLSAEQVENEGLFAYDKRWNTSNDDRVCPICRPLHRETVRGARTAFDTTAGPMEGPPAHPGCRCWVSFVPVIES